MTQYGPRPFFIMGTPLGPKTLFVRAQRRKKNSAARTALLAKLSGRR